jgi:hypothetical protein
MQQTEAFPDHADHGEAPENIDAEHAPRAGLEAGSGGLNGDRGG